MDIEDFISRWTAREGGAERANYMMFLGELCSVLGVQHPDPADADRSHNDYVFERAVRPRESDGGTAPKRIDLYKKGAFILEAKQSRLPGKKNALPGQLSLIEPEPEQLGRRDTARGWDVMMQNARKQAEGYVFLLDADHPAPPFIITCDVGNCLELFADFTGTGRAYNQFPDRKGFRIFLDELRDPDVRKLLATVWTDPQSLDPTRESARVTRGIAARLAEVSKALEEKHPAEEVAHFLMRCIFTMFAEDVDLLPKGEFTALLEECLEHPESFAPLLEDMWSKMDEPDESKRFFSGFKTRLRYFNGALFRNARAYPLPKELIGELLAAARAKWTEVDPAIFGTLLEQALDKTERKKLGAHYTPRSYVQRLVDVTVMEPLRADWQAALTRAQAARDDGKNDDAIKQVRAFHHQLCATRVLDPACGTGNFLYVSLEMIKQLEGEVIQALSDLGDHQANLIMQGETVDPHQFLGLELNVRAAAIAELVVWIGYLQWHYRNYTSHPAEPILREFKNINFGRRDGYDAVLTWDGFPETRVEVVDGKRVESYPNARRPEWPEADFIVGNPPFSGVRLMRSTLGTEYVDALREAYPIVPDTSDYVLYWWHTCANRASQGKIRRFGLITTNSITQPYSRKIIAHHLTDGKNSVRLIFAVSDHPWVDTSDGANVRVAMTVAERVGQTLSAARIGVLSSSDEHAEMTIDNVARISEALTRDTGLERAQTLQANKNICFQGVVPAGEGFKLDLAHVRRLRELQPGLDLIKPYLIGRDLMQQRSDRFIIDAYGETLESLRARFPYLYSHLLEQVAPERINNSRKQYRDLWWLFAEPRPAMRDALLDLYRYIGTPYTSKHRAFVFLDRNFIPDAMVYCIAESDAWLLAALSSRIHLCWSLLAGGTLEDRPRYNKARTFDPFPFPDPPEDLKARLRALGEELDATRKRVQAEHPDLTLTGLYNVLEKLRAGTALTPADEDVKQRGLVLILKDLHDQIDEATADAYGWPRDLTDEQILERLVALNAERAKEEATGQVRWLRPDYQIPRFAKGPSAKTGELALGEAVVAIDKGLPAFPTDRYEQVLAVQAALGAAGRPVDPADLARGFKRGGKRIEQRVVQALNTLARYGNATALTDGRFVARKAA